MLKTVSTQLALASDTLSEILANGNTSGPNNIIMDAGYGINGTLGATTPASVAATTGTFSGTVTANGLNVAGNVSVDGGTIKLDGNYPVGAGNVALGNTALNSVNTGAQNVSIGNEAGYNITSGSSNTAVGTATLFANDTGSNNVAVGRDALGANTASNNTAVGYGAGSTITTGSKNTIIGRYDGNQGGLDIRTASNHIVLSDGDGNPRAYWDAAGAATFAGNLVMASGNGIDFSATAGTGTSELLDDYEEGVWTPAFISTGATFAYAEQFGSYVKVGNLVTLQMRLRTSSVTGTTSNATNITGIPFTSANLDANNASAGSIGLCDVSGGLAISIGNNEASLINLWNFGIVAAPSAASISGKYFIATISYRSA